MITEDKIKTPEQYCAAYLATVYAEPIPKLQTLEVSRAFHAGIEGACRFIHRYIAGQEDTDDEILVERLVRFRSLNKQRALQLQQPQPK